MLSTLGSNLLQNFGKIKSSDSWHVGRTQIKFQDAVGTFDEQNDVQPQEPPSSLSPSRPSHLSLPNTSCPPAFLFWITFEFSASHSPHDAPSQLDSLCPSFHRRDESHRHLYILRSNDRVCALHLLHLPVPFAASTRIFQKSSTQVKCAVLPLSKNVVFEDIVKEAGTLLGRAGPINREDNSGPRIGRIAFEGDQGFPNKGWQKHGLIVACP